MTLRILATAAPATHPGHKIEASQVNPVTTGLTHPNGFGPGDHYTLEVDATYKYRMVVEPSETTRRWYMASTASGGLTISDINTAAGGGIADEWDAVVWLRSAANTDNASNHLGLRDDKRVSTDDLWFVMNYYIDTDEAEAIWIDMAAGSAGTQLWGHLGESALHPAFVGCTDPTETNLPKFTQDYRNEAPLGNLVVGGVKTEYADDCRFLISGGTENHIFMDCDIEGEEAPITVSVQPSNRITLFACKTYNVTRAEPKDGIKWAASNDRCSGSYFELTTGRLVWRCTYDHNGWAADYDPLNGDWNNGTYGQPPTIYNHNNYDANRNADLTYLEHLSTRAAHTAIQGRPGMYANVNVFADNQFVGQTYLGDSELTLSGKTGTFTGSFSAPELTDCVPSGAVIGIYSDGALFLAQDPSVDGMPEVGDTITGRDSGAQATIDAITLWGNYSVRDRQLVMSTGYKTYPPADSQGQKDSAFGAVYRENVIRNLLIANGADPQDATDEIDKGYDDNSLHKLNGVIGWEGSESEPYVLDYALYNFGPDSLNNGIGGIPTATLDEVTIGGYVDDLRAQTLGTETTDSAIDWLKANYRHPAADLAIDIYNYGATRFSKDTIGHTAGATAVFTPNTEQDGFRMDGIGNWSVAGVADYPVDGDNVDLDGNLAFNFMTFRLADLDFGTGGGIRMYGGLISCSSSQAVSAGSIDLRNGAKFRVSGTQTTDYAITATGGRYEVDGTISGVSGSFSGFSQCAIYGGGSLTIDSGKTLTLTGDDDQPDTTQKSATRLRCGFDADDASTATLTVNGTLAFIAGAGGIPKIREFRTGRFGFEDLGGGVTGQPVDPNVVSTVVLGSGSSVTVDITGLTPGSTHDLIDVDSLTDNGASLPSGVTVVGNKLQLSVP